MSRLFKLQFLGPLALFLATLSAELAVRALAYAPSSELLWFVNLKMFGIFQRSYYVLSDVVSIQSFQLIGIALPIFLLACYGLAARRRLPLAVASNLGLGYAALLLLCWQSPGAPTTQASLGSIAVPSGAGFYVLAGILGTSLLSFAVSHLLYLRAARSEI
ncbi:hypothetical protein JQ609_31785 [Bradyrhizobium sp. AUGA SZCCT0169]|uniref:hypothetical protein n=1 Tax=Bradyrhizobium sp. AUGA SZCCT0169 TaxID=2807663 RepID=UPI001BABF939|nr:hypothetical protein [Bradyrhizobium sp. AUGA SZCCT0169]MBR1251486.1 hypothetical protein [Bradyrhizobium sp. AUGA SZCCT0169]